MKTLSILIPCYNERGTIEAVLRRVRTATLPDGWNKELIVVDDGSRDGSGELLASLTGPLGFKLERHEKNRGKGAAVKTGLARATGDYLLVQDADLEYDPDDIAPLLRAIDEGRGRSVFGSRVLGGHNVPYSRIYFHGGQLVTKLFNGLFRTRITDITTCYKVFPRAAVPLLLRTKNNDFAFDAVEMTYVLHHLGPIAEIPIRYQPRSKQQGKKLSWQHGLKCVWLMFQLSLDDLIRRLRFGKALKLIRKDALVLDIGCGPQYGFLRQVRGHIAHGYGVDKKGQPIDDGNLTIRPWNFDEASMTDLPTDIPPVDQAVMLAVLEHVTDGNAVLRAIARRVKPGGELILTTPSRASKPVLEFLAYRLHLIDEAEIRDHKHYFSKTELIAACRDAGFREVRHRYFELGFNHFIHAVR